MEGGTLSPKQTHRPFPSMFGFNDHTQRAGALKNNGHERDTPLKCRKLPLVIFKYTEKGRRDKRWRSQTMSTPLHLVLRERVLSLSLPHSCHYIIPPPSFSPPHSINLLLSACFLLLLICHGTLSLLRSLHQLLINNEEKKIVCYRASLPRENESLERRGGETKSKWGENTFFSLTI